MADTTVENVYNRLNAINRGMITSGKSGYIQQREWDNFNAEADKLVALTGDDTILTFKIVPRVINSHPSVTSKEYISALNSLLHYIYDEYDPDVSSRPIDGGDATVSAQTHTTPITISQDNNQRVEVSVEFNQTILGLNEVLTKNEDKYEDGSPEKGFIQKLKGSLSTAKSSLEVLGLVLQVGIAFKLPVEKIMELITHPS